MITTPQKIFIGVIILTFIIAFLLNDENIAYFGIFLFGIFVMMYVEHEEDDNAPPTQFTPI